MKALLADGIAALGLQLDAATQQRLLAYIALLDKWNKVYNLTAVRDPAEMLTQHLLDSLAVLPYVDGGTLLDVGTGPGLPGIPLALARPELAVTLLDSNQKKTTFVRQAIAELRLANATVVCTRIEAWQPEHRFDAVISRAFSELSEFVKLSARFCRPGGRLLAMKGVYPEEEMSRLPAGVTVERVIALAVPGLDKQRHLLEMKARES